MKYRFEKIQCNGCLKFLHQGDRYWETPEHEVFCEECCKTLPVSEFLQELGQEYEKVEEGFDFEPDADYC